MPGPHPAANRPPVVFDLDGTLIDSAPDLHAACVKTLAPTGAPTPSLAQVISYVGDGVPTLVTRAMHDANIPFTQQTHAALTADFLRHYGADQTTLTSVYPHVPQVLEALRSAGHRLAICTNKPESPARAILQALGLNEFFETLTGGDTLARRKPDPAPLRHTLAQLNAPACLYVGDSEIDAQTAKAAGQPFALFTKGYRKAAIEALPHRLAFDDFRQLAAYLGR